MLKQIGKFFLYKNGYNIVGEEVYMTSSNEFGVKNITDALGIKMKYNKNNTLNYDIVSMSIEAKQSKQDYYNSFVSSADYNYIIIPKDMLGEKDRYIDGVGIIEVDFDKFEFNYDSKGKIISSDPFLNGVKITKRCKKNKTNNYYLKSEYKKLDLLRHVAYRSTVESLFNRHGIMED